MEFNSTCSALSVCGDTESSLKMSTQISLKFFILFFKLSTLTHYTEAIHEVKSMSKTDRVRPHCRLWSEYLLCLQVSMASEIGHRWETAAPLRYWDTRPATPTGSVQQKERHLYVRKCFPFLSAPRTVSHTSCGSDTKGQRSIICLSVPRGGASRRPNSSLQPASMNRLLNLPSRVPMYLANGWAPGEVINTRSIMGEFMASCFMDQRIIWVHAYRQAGWESGRSSANQASCWPAALRSSRGWCWGSSDLRPLPPSQWAESGSYSYS